MKVYLIPLAIALLTAFVGGSIYYIDPAEQFAQRTKARLPEAVQAQKGDTILFPGETHFANVQQLTFGGDNAEAYFSFDGKSLIFQRSNSKEGIACDQIWM